MTLSLHSVTRQIGDDLHLNNVTLTLERGTLNVLLGPTLSGKTTLMRVMAGLDAPDHGHIAVDGRDVTGTSVGKRNVAMVYQQFINYPTLSVYENIASPLRVAGVARDEIDRRVNDAAKLLRLTSMLDRTPLQLSGGQQQRTAIARALVKRADLVLMDEPLANLDYKLREELREELPRIFQSSGAIFVYATTEPSEALLLGGNTASLWQGRVTQFGPTPAVYRQPKDLITAQVFSDPPLNLLAGLKQGNRFTLSHGAELPLYDDLARLPDGPMTLAFRAHHMSLKAPVSTSMSMQVVVGGSEISGSESFVHVALGSTKFVLLEQGVHRLDEGTQLDVHVAADYLFAFDSAGHLLRAPVNAGQGGVL
ncbi:MAG: ABC transporter ATP-binding protein [Alphaproteobacteria bacterium]|jgi:glycerol transport system ATP-binding protein|nr:ABC transporter ATP-binding protein [Alphaproteobacteria bacterium]